MKKRIKWIALLIVSAVIAYINEDAARDEVWTFLDLVNFAAAGGIFTGFFRSVTG